VRILDLEVAAPYPSTVTYITGISRIFCPSAQKPLFPAFFRGSSLPFLFRHFREALKGTAGTARARGANPRGANFSSTAIRFD